jgi:integrase
MLRKVLHNARKRKVITDVTRMPFEKEKLLRNELMPDEHARYLAAFEDEAGFMSYLAQNRVYGEERESKRFASARRFGASLKPDSDAARVFFSRFHEASMWFLAALHTGLRRGDVTTLRWSDISFSEGFIRRTTTKTGHEATIPLSETLRDALLNAQARQVVSSEWAVTSADGSPYPKQTIDRYHRIALSIAGITRRVRVHDLRHTFGSALASAGVPTLFIAAALGHTSTKMTERYARPSAAAMKSITNALDQHRNRDYMDTRMDTRPLKETEHPIRDQQPKTNKATVSSGFDSILSGAVERI